MSLAYAAPMRPWLAPLVLVPLLSACGAAASPRPTMGAVVAPDVDANGVWWSKEEGALYIADEGSNRLTRWTDAGGATTVAELPEGKGLGQPVRLGDGTVVVPRLGHGGPGGLIVVPRGGPARVVPLANDRHRLGLTVAADGRIFVTWFGEQGGNHVGGVEIVTLEGVETEAMADLSKPVGVVVLGADLIVADQVSGKILAAPLTDLAHPRLLATVTSPDLIAAGPDGSVLVATRDGGVVRVEANGTTAVLRDGFASVRGVAYDPSRRRVFIVEHIRGAGGGIHVLRLPR